MSEDLISRQDAINEIRLYFTVPNISDDETKIEGYNDGLEMAISILSDLSSAEPERIIKIGQRSGKTLESAINYLHNIGWLQEHDRILTESAEPERKIIRCADCKWWDRLEEGHPYGYCRACQSGTHTERWDIHIQRQSKFDFYCADAEPKEDDDDDERFD